MKYIVVGFLLILGVAVRLVQYLSDRPLWADEAMLTVNILNRSYAELFSPLDYEQQAPIGFLLVVKWLTTVFGIDERVLRLTPFIASMGSLVLMAILTRKLLPYRFAMLALLLYVVSAPLIYYASEVKPYTLDLTIGLLLTLVALTLFQREQRRRRRLLGMLFGIGFVGLWFSQAIVFILAAIGLTGIIESLSKRTIRGVLQWVAVGIGWAVSFGFQSSLTLGQYYARYRGVWQEYYAPFPPVSIVDVEWYTQTAIEVIRRPGGISLWPIGLLTLCIGVWSLIRSNRRTLAILLLPGVFALAASSAHYYPFTGRFLLFFTPALYICIAKGFQYLFSWAWQRPWISTKIIIVAMAVVLVGNAVNIGIYRLQHPERFEVIIPLIKYYLANREPGDRLYLYYGAAFAFDYYAQLYGIERSVYIKGVERTNDLTQYQRDLQKLDGVPRVWVLFSHIYNWKNIDEEAFFLRELDRLGKRIDELHTDGASLYLYDLSI